MSIDQLIDSFKGDEHSKQELKNAHRKARKLGFIVFFCALTFFMPFGFEQAVNWPFGLFDKITLFLSFSFTPSIAIGVFVGLFSVNFFARHIKVILPEALTPTIEIDVRKK